VARRTFIAAAAAVLAVSGTGPRADSPPPYPEFTFKMGKPPEPGAQRLITVQISPEPDDGTAQQDPAGTSAAPGNLPAPARHGWFWSRVSPGLKADAARRLRQAFDALDAGPEGAGVPAPRLQAVQEIAAREGAHILRATVGTRVSPALALAVIAVESGGQGAAVSDKGAIGLMQLMPDTAARFDVADRLSNAHNIAGGVAYLDWLLKEFDGDAVLALAGYNAGESAVREHEGVPPFAETRDYVPRVLAAFRVASGLCKTAPELITDACALRLAAD